MATSTNQGGEGLRLLQLGAILFLLGLVSGFLTGVMENPRMGLSAHLQGITNGTFLLAAGAIWGRVHLPAALKALAFWLIAFGTTANWLVVQLAALWGAGSMMPLAAPGFAALAWQEQVVTLGLIAVSLTMLAGALLLVAGLFRKAPAS